MCFCFLIKMKKIKINFMFLDPPYDSEFTDYNYCSFGKED